MQLYSITVGFSPRHLTVDLKPPLVYGSMAPLLYKSIITTYPLLVFSMSAWCPYMVINVSVHNNGGLLPDIILLALCDYMGEPF